MLVIDKPAGPTSHDVVAAVRRITRVKKVGHTGTLDPLASGVLPIVLGRATRLAQFLSSAEKEYEADVLLGVSTTTFDAAGDVVERANPRSLSGLSRGDVEEAVAEFRGSYLQEPPSFSAKKILGDRAYDLARRNQPVPLKAVEVTARTLDIVAWNGAQLRLRLACSAGFYVRSLAQALGERLGTGAYLAGLVRTRSGDFSIDSAVSLGALQEDPAHAASRVIVLTQLLPGLPAITLTAEGALLAARGGFLSAGHLSGSQGVPAAGKVRLLHPDGHLVAIAEPREGGASRLSRLLHPSVVLE